MAARLVHYCYVTKFDDSWNDADSTEIQLEFDSKASLKDALRQRLQLLMQPGADLEIWAYSSRHRYAALEQLDHAALLKSAGVKLKIVRPAPGFGKGSRHGSQPGSPGCTASTTALSSKELILHQVFPGMKANYSSDPECSTKGFERFTANNPAVPFVEHEKLKLIGKRVVNCTHRLSRTLTDTGTEAVQALDWGQLLAVMSEVGADWTTAPWDADLSSMLHVEEPAVGGPANTSARSRHVTFRQPTEADEGNVRVPGFAKLQVRKNRAHGGWYIAGAIELGVGLLAASEFRDKLRQAEKEVFAIWAVNALEGIYEDTFIVLSNGFDMVRVTFHFYNNQYHPYKPCMAVHKVPGVLGASKSYQLFANDHKLANDAAPALALLVDSLWPAHGQSTVAQLQDKLDALDSMLANAVARGGLPAVCKEKRKADEAVDIGYKQARAE